MVKTRDELDELILNEIPRSLEYKRLLPGRGDGGNEKILQSIIYFANTNGGELLYGIEAKDGIPGRKTGSYPMDVSELRAAFSLSQSIADKAREFRSSRLQKILTNDVPVPVSSAGKLVLHVIAASSAA